MSDKAETVTVTAKTFVALSERLALSPDEAAAVLGCSRAFLDEHIAPELKWIRRGRRKFVRVAELERWAEESEAFTLPSELRR